MKPNETSGPPFVSPPPDVSFRLPSDPASGLTSTQESMLVGLRERKDELLSSAPDPKQRELDERWLSDHCLLRYLRAVKWESVDAATKRLKDTLQWRREFKPDQIPLDEVEPEAVTGKLYINGFDNEGRPVVVMKPGLQNTTTWDRQLQYTYLTVEAACQACVAPQETICLIIDFEGIGIFSGNKTPMNVSRRFLNVLQSHYPERLGHATFVNPFPLVETFWRVIYPFVDPVTREKVHFTSTAKEKKADGAKNGVLHQLVSPSMLEERYGGKMNWSYEHSEYWAKLRAVWEDPLKVTMNGHSAT
ncbi:CRAL/TRIO domain-containing protein [Gonapodya prolifera JEL478]|uniref:CRAL/TRIO domain-containing protein n=1 Tax=Gonapodya prolifera (strain JEL478) TaxID=1344416 RepID=A0A139AEM2_GONPJ|nr:CRAL/TRIO domain-containing protein [Gonapodya prolifera JEL478]|eukprot:KXS15276.1 CRAL/TRIO domain-containing protein [Gonapodya prolifera JEL478]